MDRLRDSGDFILGPIGQQNLSQCRTVHRRPLANLAHHSHASRGIDLIDKDNLRVTQNGEVYSFLNPQGQIQHDGFGDLDKIHPPEIGVPDLKGSDSHCIAPCLFIFFYESAFLQRTEDSV